MYEDQRDLEEQRERARQRREHLDPALSASLGSIASAWVANVAEYREVDDRRKVLRRELDGLSDRVSRLNKQGAALEAAYRSLIEQTEQQLGSGELAMEMQGMAKWT